MFGGGDPFYLKFWFCQSFKVSITSLLKHSRRLSSTQYFTDVAIELGYIHVCAL